MELSVPVLKRRLGNDDEMRSLGSLVELEVTEEGDRLKGLSESLWASKRAKSSVSGWRVG